MAAVLSTPIEAIIVMGVAGSGKSTVGARLAECLGWHFMDGDTLHSSNAIDQMRRGIALNDADRQPWLEAIVAQLDQWRTRSAPGIVACSALRRRYRDFLTHNRHLRFVYLQGSEEVIEERLRQRTGHFMRAGLMQSQLDTLEEPASDEQAITVPIDGPLDEILVDIRRQLEL